MDETRRSYGELAGEFLERNRDRAFMDAVLDRYLPHVAPGGLVVDVGCGPGFDSALFAARGYRVVGADYAREMLALARDFFGGSFVLADMRRLPFARADGLFANASLLHVPRSDVAAALKGFARVLQPAGTLYLSVKAGEGGKWVRAGGPPRWFEFWRPAELDEALRDAGLVVLDGWESDAARGNWICRIARPG